jgi:hypothetical protein
LINEHYYARSHRLAFGLDFREELLLKLALVAGAATPHCDFSVFLRRPHISFVLTGSENGSGCVTPAVSVTASTSIEPGGAIPIVITMKDLIRRVIEDLNGSYERSGELEDVKQYLNDSDIGNLCAPFDRFSI